MGVVMRVKKSNGLRAIVMTELFCCPNATFEFLRGI